MKLKKLATSTIASILLFGSIGQLAISAKPASANHPNNNLELTTKSGTSEALLLPSNFTTAENANTGKVELVNINFRGRRRRNFRGHRRRNFRRYGRRNLRRYGRRNFRRNFRYNVIPNRRRNLKFDKAFSTGNNFDEQIIRLRLN